MKVLISTALACAVASVGIPAAAHADFVFDVCPSGAAGVVSGTPTSCPFADNVRNAYFSQGSTRVLAYSPVTGGFYSMDCSYRNFNANLSNGTRHPGVLCTGGIGAAVVIW